MLTSLLSLLRANISIPQQLDMAPRQPLRRHTDRAIHSSLHTSHPIRLNNMAP